MILLDEKRPLEIQTEYCLHGGSFSFCHFHLYNDGGDRGDRGDGDDHGDHDGHGDNDGHDVSVRQIPNSSLLKWKSP